MLARTLLAPHALAEWARATPSAIALQHVDGDALTYATLHEDSLRWAAALRTVGVAEGTHVGSFLPNEFSAHRTMLALAWLRATEVPINTAYRGRMLAYALDQADVTHLVASPEGVALVAEIAEELKQLKVVIVVGPPTVSGRPLGDIVGIDELLAGVDPADDLVGPEVWDIACLLYTSGTTGPSKAVQCPWGLVHQMWSWVPEGTLDPGAGLYNALPLFHNSGRGGFNYALSRGARFIMRDKFSATHLWDDTRATDAKAVALVGPMPSVLYRAPPRPDDAANPVQSVVLGPMIPEMEEFEQRFGVRVCTAYGQTEIGCPVATTWDHGPWANSGTVRADFPFPEIRLVDEHDEPVAPGATGEMMVRTGEPWALNVGYYKMPEATAAAWRNGWFHTGDAFRQDQDGRFYFVDRMKDAIRRRGENISSFEVESIVLDHPQVVECAAFGIRTEDGDDEVMVALTVKEADSFDPEEMIRFLLPRMPRFMIPRYLEVFDDFPRNETTRRVRKNELRARGVGDQTWDRDASGPRR